MEHTKGKLEIMNGFELVLDAGHPKAEVIAKMQPEFALTKLRDLTTRNARARRLILCWNEHDKLKAKADSHDKLLAACKDISKADKDKIGNMQWDELVCVISDMINIAKAAIAKGKQKSGGGDKDG